MTLCKYEDNCLP